MVKQADKMMEDYLRGDSLLSRTYRRGPDDKPPACLDAAVLAEARKAVGKLPGRATPWVKSLSAAAVVILGVSLVVFMAREGVAPVSTGETSLPYSVPASPDAKPAGPENIVPQGAAPKPQTPTKARPGERSVAAPTTPATAIEKAQPYGKAAALVANVVSVKVSGAAGAYRFSVGVKSPDIGCKQYADWWEVVGDDGRLLYRRVWSHSHVNEQPFALEGGPVPIPADTVVWIRAHVNPTGYGGMAFKGSVRSGFKPVQLNSAFAARLAALPPLPKACEY